MNLKIIISGQRQIRWLRKLNKNFFNKYQKKEIILINPDVKLYSEKGEIESLGIKIIDYDQIKINSGERINISHDLSLIVNDCLSFIESQSFFKKIIFYRGVNILSVLANDIAEIYLELGLFLSRLKTILADKENNDFLIFGYNFFKFSPPERLSIKNLFDSELIYLSLTKECFDFFGIKPIIIYKNPTFSYLKLKLRFCLFYLIKLAKIIWRHILSRCYFVYQQPVREIEKNLVGIIIRAEAEYYPIKPVLERLRADKDIQAFILQGDLLVRSGTWKILIKNREKFVSLYRLSNLWSLLRCFWGGPWRKFIFASILNKINFKRQEKFIEKLKADRLYYSILNKEIIFKKIAIAISSFWPETMLFIDEINSFIDIYQPKLLVSMGMIDHWVGTTTKVSNLRNIQTISLQAGSISEHFIPRIIGSNKFMVYGEEIKNKLIKLGGDTNKIVVTGDPRYDAYSDKLGTDELRRNQLKEKLNIPLDKKIILITTQPGLNNKKMIETSIRFLLSRSDTILIIKPHPREKSSQYIAYRRLLSDQNKLLIISDVSVLDLIFISDVVVSKTSTTILSSLIMGIPTMIFVDNEVMTWLDTIEYLRTEATFKAYSENNFLDYLENLFNNPAIKAEFLRKRDLFIKKSVGLVDGQSTERVFNVIKQFVI